jgi:hypothetical protein
MTPAQYVPCPKLDGVASDALDSMSSRTRSSSNRLLVMQRQTRLRVQAFKSYADRFRVPTTLAKLHSDRLSNDIKQTLDKYCRDVLGPQPASRAFSAQYFDTNDVLLFCYMGERWRDGSIMVSCFISKGNLTHLNICQDPPVKPLGQQYENCTPQDLEKGLEQGRRVVCDGISVYSSLVKPGNEH